MTLRLAIGKDGIGLELAEPAALACLRVTTLTAALTSVRFPVDVSGGVARFRHRRGELRQLEIELDARALERFAAPRLRGLVGTRTPEVRVAVSPGHATVSVTTAPEADDRESPSSGVLAFELDALVEGGDVVLVVSGCRGASLPAPATALALACVEATLGRAARRDGAAFVIADAAAKVARALLPEAGARVPDADALRWGSIAADGDTWIAQAMNEGLDAAPTEAALRAREAAALLREADEALVALALEEARALCMEALERAPAHPEVIRRIVEIDARAGGRAEAALALLGDARGPDAWRLGTLPGELRAETGDTAGAIASLEQTGETETSPALAARAFEGAAGLSRDPELAAAWLDRALAVAPRSATARWARAARRVALGRIDDALADVEHLDAAARGRALKHGVWLRAGRIWQSAGLGARAAVLFERALLYTPDEPAALAGLGSALVEEGRAARGVAVLSRALDAAEAAGRDAAPFHLGLARALVKGLGDLASAVSHVTSIPAGAREALEARGLEGRWRARLGDAAGASLAFAKLSDAATALHGPGSDARAAIAVELLREGAAFERARDNPFGAQRHLAAALRLAPRDATTLREYREVGEAIAGRPRAEAASAAVAAPPAVAPALPVVLEEAEAAARVEELTRRFQATPSDDAVAGELAELLERLGRGHDLLALTFARLEEASPERREALVPRARGALERLAREAESAGRDEEARLFRDALEALAG